ncbi:MAG: TRAP transporter substrate-binding protein DctP [Gemmatimonadota bacterium]
MSGGRDGAATPTHGAGNEPAAVPLGRRAFVGRAAAGLAATTAVACGGGDGELDGAPAVQTNRTVRWRMASSYPRNLDTLWGSAEAFSRHLSELTGGRFELRPYPSGELVPGLEVLDAVQQGAVQCGQTPSYYYTGKNPALAFDTCVPFGFNARQQAAWLQEGGGLEHMRRVYADFNILHFPMGNTGAQMGGWFRREVNSASDLRGIKMRIPGMGGLVMDRIGVSVQNIAAGELFPALERGAIDAAEWVGPADDERLGLQDAAAYYYYPGWWEPGPEVACIVNQQAWDQLPSEYQVALRVAASATRQELQAAYDARNPPALARLVEGGVQLRPFSTEIMDVARRATEEMLEESAAADAGYREIYESWKQFRDASFSWFATTELAYAEYAFRKG